MNVFRVSSIESKSGHPMAAALVDYAQSNSVEPKPDRVEQFQNFTGEGIYGRIDGMEIYVGNRKISSRAGCTTGKRLIFFLFVLIIIAKIEHADYNRDVKTFSDLF